MNIPDSDKSIHSVCASVLHRRLKLAEGHDGECISNIYNQHHFISNHLTHIIQDKISTGESTNSWNNVQDIHDSVMEGRDLFEGTESAILLEAVVDNDDVPTCGNEQCNCQGQSEPVEAQGNGDGKCDRENPAAGKSNGENGETVAEADESGNINPILIPSVINHVVSFLSCADLKQCRIINKQWNEECCKFLRKRGLVKLTSQSKIVRFTAQFNNNKRFCENFYFEIAKAMDDETNKLLDIFGPFIKSVKLDFSSTSYHMTAEDFFNLIFIKLPNLEELSLVGAIGENDHFLPKDKRIENSNSTSNVSSSKSTHQSETTLPKLKSLEIFLYNSSGKNVSKHVFLIELLRCVPKLEKISVPKVPRMLSFGMPLLHTLITSEQISFNNLQHLDMDIALYNGSIDILKSKGYPLKYLNAEINSTVSEDSLHSLLETYGKTLVSLQLKFPISPVASSEFRSAASFQVLKHLTLHGYQGSLKFLEQLNLHTFGLIDNSFSLAVQRENFDRPLKARFHYQMIWTDWAEEPSQAYCFDYLNSSDTQLLRVFSNNFLNLSSLNLPHLNESDLRIIYVTFSHSLQELCMENSLCDDFGLTGINHGIVHNLNSVENIEDVRTQPFIGNLKRLRRLEILSPSIHMTDASIIYGIVYCENLKVCIIRNASISNIGLEKLVDLMYLKHLETTMCANIEGPAVKYALEKMTSQGATYVWNKYQGRLTSCCINRFLNSNSAVTCEVP